MSDEDTITPLRAVEPGPDPEILLYDYSKFLLTTTLLTFGGVLTLSSSAEAGTIKPTNLLIVLIALSISGAASISVLERILAARRTARALDRSTWWANKLAVAGLGAGVGAFSYIWLGALI